MTPKIPIFGLFLTGIFMGAGLGVAIVLTILIGRCQ